MVTYTEFEGYAVSVAEQGAVYLGIAQDVDSSDYPNPLLDGDLLELFIDNKSGTAFYSGTLIDQAGRRPYLLTKDIVQVNSLNMPHIVPPVVLSRLFSANCYLRVKRIGADNIPA